MNLMVVKNALKIGKKILVKNSPKILLAIGIGSGVGATVAGCVAMTKMEPVSTRHKDAINDIHEKKDDLEEKDYNRAVTKEYMRYSLDLGRIWSPCFFLTLASIACTLASYGVMDKRISAITSLFAATSRKFDEYRENVIADAGEEKDKFYISNGALRAKNASKKKEEDKKLITEIKKGGVISTVPSGVDDIFKYAFNEDNVQSECYSSNPGYNFQFLISKQEYFDWCLNKNGFVLLTDVYQALGLSCHKLWEEMKEGRIYGWTLDGLCEDSLVNYNDTHVLFDIWENNDISHRLFRMGQIDDVILQFNCRMFTQETLDLLATKGCYF